MYIYRSFLGKCPLPGKRPCISFQGVNVAASIQMYGNYIPGERPCGPKSHGMFKCPWALTRDTTVLHSLSHLKCLERFYAVLLWVPIFLQISSKIMYLLIQLYVPQNISVYKLQNLVLTKHVLSQNHRRMYPTKIPAI